MRIRRRLDRPSHPATIRPRTLHPGGWLPRHASRPANSLPARLQTVEFDEQVVVASPSKHIPWARLVALFAIAFSVLMVIWLVSRPWPPESTAKGSPESSGEWVPYMQEADGFAISLPSEWSVINLDKQSIKAGLDELAKQNPQLASALRDLGGEDIMATDIKFYALDLDPRALGAGFVTSMNVTKETLPASLSVDYYAQVTAAMLERFLGTSGSVSRRKVVLGGLDAAKLQYQMDIKRTSGQSITTAGYQYLILADREAFTITFMTSSDRAGAYEPLFDRVAETFRVLSVEEKRAHSL